MVLALRPWQGVVLETNQLARCLPMGFLAARTTGSVLHAGHILGLFGSSACNNSRLVDVVKRAS
jgi:hypothetical protein